MKDLNTLREALLGYLSENAEWTVHDVENMFDNFYENINVDAYHLDTSSYLGQNFVCCDFCGKKLSYGSVVCKCRLH
jgi:hypothetical protein